jgi:hypothetical protein
LPTAAAGSPEGLRYVNSARGKSPQLAVVAIARELSAFVWAALRSHRIGRAVRENPRTFYAIAAFGLEFALLE